VANLNDPCAIEDPSWIKPGKVIRTELNTKTAKATVDWANKIGASYILIDAGWYGPETSDKSDATTVTIDPKRYSGELDMQGVIDYPTAHEVGVILYVNCRALERQLDDLLTLFQKWGVAGIKFGFVNVGSQKWTKWVHDSVRKCADYKMVVDIHDDYRPTGGSRTYPNLLTQEGIKGNETMPTREENVILPFTRYLCGAADYTVCYYSSRIKTTRAHQLAASIVYYSPIQLLFWYDKPANVKDTAEMEVFKQLHTTWDESKIIHGEIGSFITTARRNGEQWFVGSMNAGERRELKIPLNFLQPGLKYQASIYSDAFPDGSDSKKVNSASIEVTSETVLTADMASNGGQAIVLTPVSNVQ
jgi:alpha-glucosidase